MTAARLSLFAALPTAVLAGLGLPCAAQYTYVFSIPAERDPAIVPVRIGGATHLFMVDSGSSVHIFDSRLKPLLESEVGTANVRVGEDSIEMARFACPEATIGSITLARDAPIVCQDLEQFRSATGREIEGVIGLPQFFANIIQFEFDRRQIRFLPLETQPRGDWGTPVEVRQSSGGIPAVEAMLGAKHRELCKIDTGATPSIGIRHTLFADLLAASEITLGTDTKYSQLHRIRTVRKGSLSDLRVADFKHTQLNVIENDESYLGLDYLRRYRVTFDIPHGTIYWKKGEQFERSDQVPQLGVGLLRKGEATVVVAMVPGSPAELAGVRAGDELISACGEPCADKPIADIIGLFRRQAIRDGDVSLTLNRNGEKIGLTCHFPKPREAEVTTGND